MSTKQQETKMSKKSNAARKEAPVEQEDSVILNEGNFKELADLSSKIAPPVIESQTSNVDEHGRKKVVMLSMDEWLKICQERNLKSKSARIRYLYGEGHNYRAVANFLGVIYQHVYNVMHQQPKKASTLAPAAETEEAKG